jgi:glycerol uptake facilitator-like aquaporin
MTYDLRRRAVAEAIGTALLAASVVGSGIMGERLAGGNVAIALLANTLATGAALFALISTFDSISGAHLNPAVTMSLAWQNAVRWREVPIYSISQIVGAFFGVVLAHRMFGLSLLSFSRHARDGGAQILSEFIASFGLVSVISACVRLRLKSAALVVAAFIMAGYWFTASTSFANPALTLARAASDTFSGIRPADVPGFILGQLFGASAATILFRWLLPDWRSDSVMKSSREH